MLELYEAENLLAMNNSSSSDLCLLPSDVENYEDPRINYLRKISYGFVMPTICLFGIIGNILNLIVLTRRNMQGTAYIYMRAYSVASLFAITFCIPFVLRVLIHKERGGWTSWPQAFYHVHLELYLGNGFIGVGVMMLSALTVERYACVCQLGQSRKPVCGPPRLTLVLLPLATLLIYLPSVFRSEMKSCTRPDGQLVYQRRDNLALMHSALYQVYQVALEVLFKIGPTVIVAWLNLRIMLVYRRTCKRRRRMRRCCESDTARSFAEERRLMLLLGSTSLIFLVCVSPMILLNITLSEDNLSRFPYQIFRALANLMEVTNYSVTFYIYCMFTEDFRRTLVRTLKCWSSEPVEPLPKLLRAKTTTSTTPSPRPSSARIASPAPRRELDRRFTS